MIVKIIKEFALNGRTYCIGETVDTTPDNAEKWVQSNLAECKVKFPAVSIGGGIPEGMEMPDAVTTTSETTYKPKRKRR